MLDIILNEKEINFNMLEKEFFREACEEACLKLKNLLETLDKILMEERDKKVYRHKGYKETAIKTLMGEVTFSRAIYKVNEAEDVETKFVYLLDEALRLDIIGLTTTNLALKISENATVMSYRENARNISDLTGQKISHGGTWGVVQALGEKIAEKDEKANVREKKKQKYYLRKQMGYGLTCREKTDRKKEKKLR